MLVSIVIDNYNYARFLRQAVDSALRQSYPNTEVIVVDDGSTDGSRDIISGYKGKIRAVLKQNGGQTSALFQTGTTSGRLRFTLAAPAQGFASDPTTVVVIALMSGALMLLAVAAVRARRTVRATSDPELIEARHIGGHSWVAYGWDGRR